MRAEKKDKRRAEIEAVALEVMRERGYEGASMLNIAKAAKASNETLYRWYGDKQRLFLEIVKSNAAEAEEALDKALKAPLPPADILEQIGKLMLRLLLGERAVALNRAAACDASGQLGGALAKGGRERVFPKIVKLMGALREAGVIAPPSDEQAATWFIQLLIGDLQLRRVIGTLPEPTRGQINQHAKTTLAAFYSLCGTDQTGV
ncbi:TetR/AcrR family transcriptional regulator [Litoreibacter arenae]|uniref:Transcriptional regulator, TetR family n=1 Tax=Litoreibacter arenae DSM 19593 TaxID=1123360 RepID=S9RZM1_9RHOB|nr:TetR/AcrR family transcriptional regulator [Litoreibacter arenae]EPX79434.1 Transcriptional regulator, TetR family [Litoreibacter arenae DSM 19593]